MIQRSELKAKAREQIKGNIGILFLCSLVIGLIIGFASPFFGVGFLIAPAFSISMTMIYLALTQKTAPQLNDVFKGFSLWGKALWLYVLTGLFIWLWSLLLIIPGIIKSYAYSMAPYILAENPNMKARDALRESERMTEGYKMELFILRLSFIGWIFLGFFTFGILYIWLIPYMSATNANFYLAIKGSKEQQEYAPAPVTYNDQQPQAHKKAVTPVSFESDEDVKTTYLQPFAIRTAGFTGVTGTYTDVSFPLRDGEEIIVGTDASVSSVVIDSSFRGISRKHASIRYAGNDNVYYITDFSTNGTWVNDKKLIMGVETRVQPGTLLKLADDKTMFLLD